jgi:hypothetical protein
VPIEEPCSVRRIKIETVKSNIRRNKLKPFPQAWVDRSLLESSAWRNVTYGYGYSGPEGNILSLANSRTENHLCVTIAPLFES